MDVSPFSSATELAAAIARRDLSALEALEMYLERVQGVNPEFNAIVVHDAERARVRARALDAGAPGGPLHGVPMTVKESFDVAGLPTTWGVPDFREHIATRSAIAVERLEAAGAIVFGKSNVPRLLLDWQSFNDVYGLTRNPWDPRTTPGGSSGGAAAALAAGLTGLELGSDIGGSIRVPAHMSGVFGHKPTWNVCAMTGHSLVGTLAPTDISVIGPLARSASDLALVFETIAGTDPAEHRPHATLLSPRVTSFEGLRVAMWSQSDVLPTDPEFVAALHELAGSLRARGALVDETARPAFDPQEAYLVFLGLLAAAIGARFTPQQFEEARERAASADPDDRSADTVLDRNYDLSHRDWLALNERRTQLQRLWQAFFQDWDVLLAPPFATPALPHETALPSRKRRVRIGSQEIAYNDLLFWPGIVGGFHLPATVAPLGVTQSGLPFGVQIVGPLYGDRTTLAIARLLERSHRAFVPPPALGTERAEMGVTAR